METLKDFIKSQQEFIENWTKSPEKIWEESIYSKLGSVQKKIAPYIKYLPEPYLGTPRNSTAVFLNYNPGPVIPEAQDIKNGTFIKKYKAIESYESFAKNTPYFNHDKGFWADRKKFVSRLSQIPLNEIKIFALEICPWHSSKFKLSASDLEKAKPYIENNVLKIAEAAAQKCTYQTIFSVGKDYYDLFKMLDFELIKEVSQESKSTNWPIKKNGVKVNRNISVWKSKSNGIYFNTWAPGSNKISSHSFDKIILELIK